MHGNTSHSGKNPHSIVYTQVDDVKEEVSVKSEIEVLKDQLQVAIKEQNFEKAAELRDKIKEMEG